MANATQWATTVNSCQSLSPKHRLVAGDSDTLRAVMGTATVPVEKQLIFREGGLDFLFVKRTFYICKKNVSGFEGTLDFLTQIS